MPRLLQGERGLGFDILAGEGSEVEAGSPAGARASPVEIVEEAGKGAVRTEEVLQVLGADRAVLDASLLSEGRCAGPAGRLPGLVPLPVRPQLVVLLSLLRIAENLVGLVDLLELLGCTRIARIHVRVVLAGQLPKGGFDLLLAGRAGHAQHLVVVTDLAGHLPGAASVYHYI